MVRGIQEDVIRVTGVLVVVNDNLLIRLTDVTPASVAKHK